MKQSEAKEFVPLIQAWSDGKTVQYLGGSSWCDLQSSANFDQPVRTYRIKPELNLRPWRPEEVPLEAFYQRGGDGIAYRVQSTYVSGGNRFLIFSGWPGTGYHCDALLEKWKHSTDGLKTWKPCGVEETI